MRLPALGIILSSMLAGPCASTAPVPPYPSAPIQLVVPWPPNGTTDILARPLASGLSEAFGQPVVLTHKPGLSGALGAAWVAKAPPDGYTILCHNVSSHLIGATLNAEQAYQTSARDFAPVTLLASTSHVIVVGRDFPARTLDELLALARSAPGEVAYASAGTGSPPHLAGIVFGKLAALRLTHVPYKGGGPALDAVVAGQVQVFLAPLALVMPAVRSGKLRALAMASARRSALLPDVPTVAEASGIDGFEFSSYFGVAAPRGTPNATIQKLHAAIVLIIHSPAYRHHLERIGADAPIGGTPEQMSKHMISEEARWSALMKASREALDQ